MKSTQTTSTQTAALQLTRPEGRVSRTGPAPVPRAAPGTVVEAPRPWLRLEGATLFAGALIAFTATSEAWWLIPLTLLVPDMSAVGYLCGARRGARLYNIAHVITLPTAVIALGWWSHAMLAVALGLVWLAHIGMDRFLGYGLKYADDPQPTHLGCKASSGPLRMPREGSTARRG